MKEWQKFGLGILTVGVTITTAIFVTKYVKKKIAENKLKKATINEHTNKEEAKEEPTLKK